jgi:hypothetical protein
VSRSLLALLLAFGVAACGGGGGGDEPEEHPATAMARVVQHELAGRRGDSFALLVREQRQIINRGLYVRCSPGNPIHDAKVVVLGVKDETFSVPGLGPTPTKAVRWQMTVPVPDEEPVELARTGHLIAQDGKWRWTLSADSFALLENGDCP